MWFEELQAVELGVLFSGQLKPVSEIRGVADSVVHDNFLYTCVLRAAHSMHEIIIEVTTLFFNYFM